jgi:phospholipid/cholesterol/gamma-HCH transport system substrate-binding protein
MITRLLAIAALAAAVVAIVVVVMGGGSYVVRARFVDAGQMVKGGTVQVAGRSVGSVKDIKLAPDGVAELVMEIDDDEWSPLRRGTVARIRTVGLSGIANRFIDLTPGPSTGEPIPDDGVLSTAETRPIVDLDILFNSLDPPTRKRLQRIISSGSQLFAGDAAQNANDAFGYLAPALAESDRLAEELARDRVAVDRLITTGARTASALASRSDDITEGISSTATTLRAIAAEREALASGLSRAPAILERPDGILGGLRNTLRELRPALREARPVAPRLATVLRQLVPVGRATRPVLAQTRALLPPLTRALRSAPGLADVAVPALRSTTSSLLGAAPVVAGLRPYAPDLVAGFFDGLGKAAGYYDANGHYGRISLQAGTTTLTGLLGGVLGDAGTSGVSSGNVARCPGSAAEPAQDGSNPWIPDPSVCDPGDGVR